MIIKTKDEIVLRIIKKIDERSMMGQEKYGDTMMSEVNSGKKDLARFMVDVQEELTDMLLYMESARACLRDEIEECYLEDRMNIIGRNGNDGLHYAEEMIEKSDARKVSKHPEPGPPGHIGIKSSIYPGDIWVTHTTINQKPYDKPVQER